MTDESMEDRLRRIEGDSELELLRRENAELRMKLKAAGSNTPRYITPQTLEDELKEVSSHVVLPKGKYTVKFDIIIDESGVLEIEPGTELYFSEYAGIIAYGTLRAVGTEQDTILFTALNDRWRDIAIAGRLASDSVLDHCAIRHGNGRKVIEPRGHFTGFEIFGDYINGGGLLMVYADPTVRNCVIEHCESDKGGGLYLTGSNPKIIGNTISGNHANDGGGIYLYRSSPRLEGNTISDNRAESDGGGIYLLDSNPHLTGNTISGNHAMVGGGLYLSSSNPHLKGNTISGNHADLGGGISLCDSYPALEGNAIQGNKPNDVREG